MSYIIALNFEDGVSRFIQCHADEKVLDAAYRQKINLPMDCSDGVCGTCKCHCESGKFDLGDDFLDEALSDTEVAQQMVLTCQMVPESDCVINVPMASTLCKTTPQTWTTTISQLTRLSDSTLELELECEEACGIDFLSGQYVNLTTPQGDVTRAYSFSSLPGANRLTFLIRNVPNGAMSHYLSELAKTGDRMTLAGPQGSFYLREVQRPLLLLAGGTGLSPLLSILYTLARQETKMPIHLIYGVSRDTDRVKLDVLQKFTERLADFSYQLCVSDPETSEPLTGHVTDHIHPNHLHEGEVDIYLCGPPPMVDSVMSWLQQQHITPQHFYYEKFTPQTAEISA
ncbi:benzoate 1,2-dioxygenase electron transfer component BenC [Rosenbergiella nectarea]|uniref:benzoate 1,2-dioxygenase electron transfer component BenC n=1 Tax=Rosenbergiella nectarea TaxID=988801 RepID=UPI001BD9B8F7|nr:benzoate 1,2-dioxygenase electron transfer component BenC [Rosenbergiella nectarea]MBT0729202.1 2Fe-2S iron-sulfur cluster binding domain-containing protein [Rosenbergiella nectarea subsp. apis]